MIDGLRITLTGEELQRLLDATVAEHREASAHWERERKRSADDSNGEPSFFPEHICENEARQAEWRANVIAFVRDHLDISETYRLDMDDLKSADLLPDKPDPMDQDLGPYAERICNSPEIVMVTNPDAPKH